MIIKCKKKKKSEKKMEGVKAWREGSKLWLSEENIMSRENRKNKERPKGRKMLIMYV